MKNAENISVNWILLGDSFVTKTSSHNNKSPTSNSKRIKNKEILIFKIYKKSLYISMKMLY